MKTPRSRFLAAIASHDALEFRAFWCPDWTLRRILKRQSKSTAFEHPAKPGVSSWLDHPKAEEVTEAADGHWVIGTGETALHYRIPSEVTT